MSTPPRERDFMPPFGVLYHPTGSPSGFLYHPSGYALGMIKKPLGGPLGMIKSPSGVHKIPYPSGGVDIISHYDCLSERHSVMSKNIRFNAESILARGQLQQTVAGVAEFLGRGGRPIH